MPKVKNSNATFWVIFKRCESDNKNASFVSFWRLNSNLWKIIYKMRQFLIIFKQCASKMIISRKVQIESNAKFLENSYFSTIMHIITRIVIISVLLPPPFLWCILTHIAVNKAMLTKLLLHNHLDRYWSMVLQFLSYENWPVW